MGVIVIDCQVEDLESAAQFWAGALGCEPSFDLAFPDYVELHNSHGDLQLLLQAVDHDSRLHMDIETDDRERERQRLVALGATVVREIDEEGKHWTIMEAPTGHRFCLVKPQTSAFAELANVWKDRESS